MSDAASESGAGAAHVAIVGAGIYGVSTALCLQRDGFKVTLIDRIPPGDPKQTSYGNAGLLARSAVVPVSVPGLLKKLPGMLLDPNSPLFMRLGYLPKAFPWLTRFLGSGKPEKVAKISEALSHILSDAVDQHRAISRGTAAEAFIREGDYIYLYESRAAFEDDAYGFGLRKEHGFSWDERDRARLLKDDPLIGETYGFGVSMANHAWIVNPGAYVAALAESFAREGGEIVQGEVAYIHPGEGHVELVIDGERRRFDKLVLSAGAWSGRFAKQLGHEPRLEAERGYHLMLTGCNIAPHCPYMLADSKFVATPMEVDGKPAIRLAGLVEIGGLEAGPSKAPLAFLERRIKRLYPTLTWEHAEPWLGHRPSTVDSLPMIGESPKAPGVFFAFGAQHIGLTSGPKAGRLVADLISGRRPNIDMSPYRLDRFS